jgi:hypothetical protein
MDTDCRHTSNTTWVADWFLFDTVQAMARDLV